jgi:hypothetical protein
MSPLISLSRDKSLWRFEKVLDHKWQEAPRPFGGRCSMGTLHRFNSHRYMILNIDGHELEIAAVYQKMLRSSPEKKMGTSTVCHLDSSYVGSNVAFYMSNRIYGMGSMRSLTEGSGRFMYLEVGGTLVGVSSPRIVERETRIPTRTYRMINPIVQVWSRVKPEQRPFVGSELIELKESSPSERLPGSDVPRYWLGGPEKKSEPFRCNCASESQSFTRQGLEDGATMGFCKWKLKESEPCDCDWCSNRLKRFGSSGTAKSNKNSASQAPSEGPASYDVGKTKGGAE